MAVRLDEARERNPTREVYNLGLWPSLAPGLVGVTYVGYPPVVDRHASGLGARIINGVDLP
jgi:hypothetical protein